MSCALALVWMACSRVSISQCCYTILSFLGAQAAEADQKEWEAFISQCNTGFSCKKHGRWGSPHERVVLLDLKTQARV